MRMLLFFVLIGIGSMHSMECDIYDERVQNTRKRAQAVLDNIYLPYYNVKKDTFPKSNSFDACCDCCKRAKEFQQESELIYEWFRQILVAKKYVQINDALEQLKALYASKCKQHIDMSGNDLSILYNNYHDFEMYSLLYVTSEGITCSDCYPVLPIFRNIELGHNS